MDKAREVVPQDGDHDNRHDSRHDANVVPLPVIKPATASARLRAAREMQGLTTVDVAARTRITLRHIEALDRGDFASLPGRPYVLGFVRSYARVVGLDDADLVALARSELDAGAPRPAPRVVHQFDVDDPAKTPSRTVTWLALLLVIAVLLAGGVFWRSYYAPATDLPSLVQPDPAPPAVAAKPVATAAPSGAGPVVFTAREDGVWVKFYDGKGQQLMQKQLALGESYTVPADAVDPMVWTGRPDALTVTIGGQAVPPLSDHRGIVHVPVTAQALLSRAQPAATGSTQAAVPGPGNGSRPARHRAQLMDTGGIGTTGAEPPPVATPSAPAPAPAAAPASAAATGAVQ
jgi:transcriptional regulator with XRE-family HTH domain